MSRVPPIPQSPYEGVADLRKGRPNWLQVRNVHVDCLLIELLHVHCMYMHTNLACTESETSDVESASNPTKPL